MLERERITAVPVVDDQGALVGSISALDVLRQGTAAGTHAGTNRGAESWT
ncbi:CBS domain-containing protein [Dactylosporangium sp. NPDC049140]